MVRHLSERKRAEESLRIQRDKLEGIIGSLGDGVDVVSQDHRVLFQNKVLRDRFGDLTGKLCYEGYMARETPCEPCPMREAIATGETQTVELTGVDGRECEVTSTPFNDVDGQISAIEVVRDVTERKRAEEALQESEAMLRRAQRIARLGSWELDVVSNELTWSDEMYRLYGFKPEEFDGSLKTVLSVVHPEDLPNIQAAAEAAVNEKRAIPFEYRITTPDGEERAVRAEGDLVLDEAGKIVRLIGTAQDITERKRAEEALRESEEKYRTLVQDSIDGIAVAQGNELKFVNRALLKLMGYRNESEMVDRPFTDFISPAYRELVAERARLRREGQPVPSLYEHRALRKDGSEFPIEVSVGLITYQGDQAFQVVIRDITERQQSEEALRESEQRFRKLSEAAFEGIAIHDGGRILDANLTLAEMFGYELSEMVGREAQEFTAPESRDLIARNIRTGYLEPFEAVALRKDGSTFDVEIRAKSIPHQGRNVTVTAIRDISERKRAERALRESEAKYRQIFEEIQDILYRVDTNGTIIEVSPSVERYGYTRDGLLGTRAEDIFVDPAEHAAELSAALAEGEILDHEVRLKTGGGEMRYASLSAHLVTDATGDVTGVEGVIRDITERKQAADALRESEERFQKLAEATSEGIVVHEDALFLDANRQFAEMFGYEIGEIIGMDGLSCIAPEGRDTVRHHIQSGFEGPYETVGLKKDGSTFPMEVRARTSLYRGRAVRFAIARDLTEQKRAERALRDSEERFRILSQAALEGIIIHEDGNITDANEAFAAMCGYELSEVLGMNALDLAAPEYRDLIRQNINSEYEGSFEAIGAKKDGTSFIADVRARAMSLDGRAVTVIAVRDITDRKMAEEALRESEERFRTLSRAALEGILIHDRGEVLDANLALATMFGYEATELVGKSLPDFVPPEWRDFVREKMRSEQEEHFEVTALRKDGTEMALEVRGRPMSYRGRAARVVAIRDISERKRAEAAIREAREELEDRVERRMERGIPYGLTFRELTVLNLVAAGMSDKEIGTQLGISRLTARKHVENILAKMGSTSRTEASVRALREEIVD